jgi:hypothetical protein
LRGVNPVPLTSAVEPTTTVEGWTDTIGVVATGPTRR